MQSKGNRQNIPYIYYMEYSILRYPEIHLMGAKRSFLFTTIFLLIRILSVPHFKYTNVPLYNHPLIILRDMHGHISNCAIYPPNNMMSGISWVSPLFTNSIHYGLIKLSSSKRHDMGGQEYLFNLIHWQDILFITLLNIFTLYLCVRDHKTTLE